MIILSQDKKSLWNIDNALSIEARGPRVVLFEPHASSPSTPHILGTYEKESRALAVLAEIFSYFEPVIMLLRGDKAEITPAIMNTGVIRVPDGVQTETIHPLSYRMPPE